MTGGLRDVVRRARADGIGIHTLLVSRGGERTVDVSAPGFSADAPHRLYSVSKSFTGLAVLLLADRGALDVDDLIAAHFPERGQVHPWLAATRVDDLLTMTGPHRRTTFDGDDWLDSYFRVTPTHRPGTLFTYDTSASYVLAELVRRRGGAPLPHFLQRHLFAPLGIGTAARWLDGPDGIPHGGSGLIATPADMLAVAELLNARGGGILPPGAIDRLIEPVADPRPQQWKAPFRHAYGRQTWLPADGVWMMFGLGGQIVLGDPVRRLAVVVTADTTPVPGGDQRLAEWLVDAITSGTLDDADALDSVPLSGVDGTGVATHAASARRLLGSHVLVSGEAAPGTITIDADAGALTVRAEGRRPLQCRPGDAVVSAPTVVTAAWRTPHVLDIEATTSADDIATQRIRLVATDDGLLTIDAHGFGPGSTGAETWRGTYRAVTP